MPEPTIFESIDDRLDCLEVLAKSDCREAITALRKLAALRAMLTEYTDAEIFGRAALDVIDPLIKALTDQELLAAIKRGTAS